MVHESKRLNVQKKPVVMAGVKVNKKDFKDNSNSKPYCLSRSKLTKLYSQTESEFCKINPSFKLLKMKILHSCVNNSFVGWDSASEQRGVQNAERLLNLWKYYYKRRDSAFASVCFDLMRSFLSLPLHMQESTLNVKVSDEIARWKERHPQQKTLKIWDDMYLASYLSTDELIKKEKWKTVKFNDTVYFSA